jgi:hypothetical protein
MVKQKQKIKRTNKHYILILIIFFPTFFILEYLSLFMPVVGGFAAFPIKTIQCGHQPYIVNRFAGLHSYTKPGDGLYRGPDVFTKSRDYYCTEAQAQKAGNKPSLWLDQCKSSQHSQTARCIPNGDGFDAIAPFFITLTIISGTISYIVSLQFIKQKMKSKKRQ